MLKKIFWGFSFIAVMCVSVGLTILAMNRHVEAKSQAEPAISPNGLPYTPISGPYKPPFLTAKDLLTKGQDEDKVEIATLLYTYGYFHDSGNGAGVASVFTKDGAIEGLWNNNGNVLVGRGCFSQGEQLGRVAVDAAGATAKPGTKQTPRPFPGHSHNVMSNVIVQVNGDTGTLRAYFTRVLANVEGNPPVGVAPNTATVSHTGEYVTDVKRTPEGWRIYRHRIISDVTGSPIPPPSATPRPCS